MQGSSREEAESEGDPASASDAPVTPRSPRAPDGVYQPTEDIYSFMVLYPEIYRLRHANYWNSKVVIAGALLFINILMQVSITHIISSHLLLENESFRKSLLDETNRITEFHQRSKALLSSPAKASECCRGKCGDSSLPCCPPEDRAGPPASHQSALKPGLVQRREVAARRTSRRTPGQGAQHAVAPDESRLMLAGEGEGEAHPFFDLGISTDAWGSSWGSSLCRRRNGTSAGIDGIAIDCAQPSFGFLDKWSQLDWDGDGVWTFKEAQMDSANLACELRWTSLTTEDIFRSACRTIERHFEDLAQYGIIQQSEIDRFVPKEVSQRKSLTRAYFEFWRGAVVLCASTEMAKCGDLVKSGIFDGALPRKNRSAVDGIYRLDKALDQCQKWAMSGGLCEKALPVTYVMYKQRVQEKCGSRVLALGPGTMYQNPVDRSDRIWFADVTFSNLLKYVYAGSSEFIFFLFLIMFIWLARCSKEVHVTLRFADFVYNYPVTRVGDPLCVRALSKSVRDVLGPTVEDPPAEPEPTSPALNLRRPSFRYDTSSTNGARIPSISSMHKATCVLILLVRTIILVCVFYAGTLFLLDQSKYTDLLIGAVALAFVFELPELSYKMLLGNEEKEEIQLIEPMVYRSSIPQRGLLSLPLSAYFWGLVICPAVACGIVWWHHWFHTRPILEALQCLCSQTGPRCLVARYQTRDWWNVHWPTVASAHLWKPPGHS